MNEKPSTADEDIQLPDITGSISIKNLTVFCPIQTQTELQQFFNMYACIILCYATEIQLSLQDDKLQAQILLCGH